MKRSGKRRGSAVLIRFMLMIMGLFVGNFFRTIPAFAAEPGDPGQEVWTQDAGSTALDLSEIENYLDRIGEQKTAGMTFGELMNILALVASIKAKSDKAGTTARPPPQFPNTALISETDS